MKRGLLLVAALAGLSAPAFAQTQAAATVSAAAEREPRPAIWVIEDADTKI